MTRRSHSGLFLPKELRKDYQERLNVACKTDAGDGLEVSRVLSEICHEIGMIRVAGASGIDARRFIGY